MKSISQTNQDNVIYTYIPISLEALQTAMDQQNQPVSLNQNVYLKKFSDGKYVIVGSGDDMQNENISFNVVKQEDVSVGNAIKNNIVTNTFTNNENAELHETIQNINDIDLPSDRSRACLKRNGRPRSNTESIKCNVCGETFEKNVNYRKHLEVHRNSKKYKCEQCFESYNVEDNFKLHKAIHEKGQPTCPLCERKFQRLASLKSHLLLHQVDETFSCKECLAEFEQEEEYNKHVNSHGDVKVATSESIPYICSYCNYLFEDPKEYKEHVSFHIKIKKLVLTTKRTRRRNQGNKEYAHKCDVCKKSFPKSCLLERHNRIHSGERPFACTKCNKAFAQKCTLQIHLFKHTGVKPYKCTLCPAEYFQKGNLRVHVEKTHTAPPNGEKLYKCTQCTCIFRKVASLNAHISKAHGGAKPVDELSISALREQLSKLQRLSNHEAPAISADSIKNIEILDQVTSSNETFVKLADSSIEGSLRRYLVKQRRVGSIKWFICSYCSKEFKKPSDLIRHIRVHTREKPYKCTRCPHTFALKSTLISHMNTHFTKREYQCVHCLKMFTSARTLNVHYRKHDKNNPRQTIHYKCSTCNKTFNCLTKADLHMNLHEASNATSSTVNNVQVVMKQPMVETANGLLPVPAPKSRVPSANADDYKNRPHKCCICNAAFMKPVHMKRHMLIHSGEKNYKCDICTKSFYTSYALKEHVQLHSNIKNFACKICNKRFTTNILLKRHVVKHSTARPYVCPYCKNRFKTVTMCRKHIMNVHRRDINIEIQALIETGEIADVATIGETAKIIDLADTLSENPFGINLVQSPEVKVQTVLPEVSRNSKIVKQTKEKQIVSRKIKSTSKRRARKSKSVISRPSLQADMNPNGAISESINQINATELQDRLNQEFINQLAANSQWYIDKSGNYTLTTAGSEIENVGPQDDNPVAYSTIYISYDELQSVNANLYNSLLPQVKLEGNDPILMSALNEPQESNILFMDPTLAQSPEFQNDSQNFETFINPILFNSNVSVGDLNLNSNNLNMSLPVERDGSILPSLTESKISENNAKLIISNDNVNLNDSLIITLSNDDLKSSELNYFPNINFNLNNNVDSINVNNSMISIPDNVRSTTACSVCKSVFDNVLDLQKHHCIDIESLADGSGPVHNCHAEEHGDSAAAIVPDFNDQLQTAHVEVSSEEPDDLKCLQCNKSFSCEAKVLKHIVMVHGSKNIKSRKTLDTIDRARKIDGTKKIANACSFCNKTFKKPSDLKRHIRTHTGEKPFGCDKCEKSFSLKSTLQSHLRTHNPGGNKEFTCIVCNTNYSCKASLRTHMLIHTGVRPYPCHLCPSKFRTSAHRKSHIANHLKDTHIRKDGGDNKSKHLNGVKVVSNYIESLMSQSPKNVPDEVIDNNLQTPLLEPVETLNITPIEILQHLQNSGLLLEDGTVDVLTSSLIQLEVDELQQDKQTVAVMKPRDFECDVCQKRYISKAVLKKHQKIHKQGFKCGKCGKQFLSEDLLAKHTKLHLGYRPFSCLLCANSFSEEGSLKTHMKRIHNAS